LIDGISLLEGEYKPDERAVDEEEVKHRVVVNLGMLW